MHRRVASGIRQSVTAAHCDTADQDLFREVFPGDDVVAITRVGGFCRRDELNCQDYAYMQTGTVKFFNTTRGFGFISPDDGSKDGLGYLSEGQRVRFEVQRDPRGPKAVNLQAA